MGAGKVGTWETSAGPARKRFLCGKQFSFVWEAASFVGVALLSRSTFVTSLASICLRATYCKEECSLWMNFIILQAPLLGGTILRDSIHVMASVSVLLCDYEKTFDLLILDDITRSLRHSSERIPVDGGIVSTPSIKNSSYVKVAFIDRGSDTIPPSTGIFPTHSLRRLVAIMSPEYSSTYSFLVKGFMNQMQINYYSHCQVVLMDEHIVCL